jgi:hypothetical protein
LAKEPNFAFLLGWDSLQYAEQKDTEIYWSPKLSEGIFFGAKVDGTWEEFTYGLDAEISFKNDSVGASRSISGRLYYQLTERLNAGVILSYSESPRQDDDDYNHLTSIFELYYRF